MRELSRRVDGVPTSLTGLPSPEHGRWRGSNYFAKQASAVVMVRRSRHLSTGAMVRSKRIVSLRNLIMRDAVCNFELVLFEHADGKANCSNDEALNENIFSVDFFFFQSN